jgi:hypothetical protein
LSHRERGWQRDVIVFDLGLGGACVEASSAQVGGLLVGDRVQVSFITAERWDPLQVAARVAWMSAARAGIAFEYASPESTWGIFELLVTG